MVLATFFAGIALGAYTAVQGPVLGLDVAGPDGGVTLHETDLPYVAFTAESARPGLLDQARLWLDGTDVTDHAELSDGELAFQPGELPDGAHDLVLEIDRGFPFGAVRHRWDFRMDARAAGVTAAAASGGSPGPGQQAGGRAPMVVQGVDAAGSTITSDGALTLAKRERPSELRSVHVTAYAWANDSLRQSVMDLVESGRINSVQLDLKDEGGQIGYDSDIPLAEEIGSDVAAYDLEEAVETLHDHDVHIVGRIVAFRDAVHAEAAWDAGQQEQVLQTPAGEPYAGYGGFTNFAHPEVRQYNIDIAVEAARAGVDDILYDYVRRPEAPLDALKVPELDRACPDAPDGGECTPADAIVTFLDESRQALAPYGVWHGASVYGIASTRPDRVAQEIPRMAEHVDYIGPMVYPSHWGPGEYGVASPEEQPREIVARSIEDFQKSVEGTGAQVIPWLQDFSLRVPYGPEEVRAQIEAAREAGAAGWLLWSPQVRYTAEALDPVE